MTAELIILFSGILLLAYLLDLSSKITRIPTVIWLLVIGITLKQFTTSFGLQAPSLQYILPVFGTIGLILIVLEGALDLKLCKKTIPVIKGALLKSFFPFAIFTACISFVLVITFSVSWQVALINVIPFAIISSAIAIPSVKFFNAQIREFITYESSISDIIGVLCFNF